MENNERKKINQEAGCAMPNCNNDWSEAGMVCGNLVHVCENHTNELNYTLEVHQ